MDNSAFDEVVEMPTELGGLRKDAEELVTLEKQITEVELLLKKLNGRANELKISIIPDKMAEVGLNDFTMTDGTRLKVEDFVSGSLPKDPVRRAQAIAALEQVGGARIIRNEINLEFEKSQHNEAMALADELRGKGFAAEVKSGVHPQTYLAFIRECMRNGEAVDADKLGVFIGRKTKVEMP